jgi:hypothetical protein
MSLAAGVSTSPLLVRNWAGVISDDGARLFENLSVSPVDFSWITTDGHFELIRQSPLPCNPVIKLPWAVFIMRIDDPLMLKARASRCVRSCPSPRCLARSVAMRLSISSSHAACSFLAC